MTIRLWASVLLIAAVMSSACTGSSVDGELRATVEVEYLGEEQPLRFEPSRLIYGTDLWATHEVEFDIATDEWIQDVSVHDRYVLKDGSLVPAGSAVLAAYTLSDEGDFGGSFTVEIPEPVSDDVRAGLSLPVSLTAKPMHEGQLLSHNAVVRVEFVYEGFVAADPLVTFCVEADQLLWNEADRFDPDAFAEAGEGVLDRSQIEAFEVAAEDYEEEVLTNGHWDPGRFFDLVEDICDMRYDERWQAFS